MAHPCPQVPPTAGTALQAVLTECHCCPRDGLHAHASAHPDTHTDCTRMCVCAQTCTCINARAARHGHGCMHQLRLCAQTCAYRHVHTAGAHTRVCTHMLTCMCRCMHACVHTGVCMHLRSSMHTCVHSWRGVHVHTHRGTRTHMGIRTGVWVRTQTCICTRAFAHARRVRIHACSHTCSDEAHKPALTLVPAYLHTHAHTRLQLHTCTPHSCLSPPHLHTRVHVFLSQLPSVAGRGGL